MESNKIKTWFRSVYHQIVQIKDTPHRKAMGLALGVFMGIFPGVGPLAALAASFIFRVNRVAALLGSVVTNTWLSVVTLGFAIKIGSLLMGEDVQKIQSQWQDLVKDFRWETLKKGPILDALSSVILGFIIVSAVLAVGVYIVALGVLMMGEKFPARTSLMIHQSQKIRDQKHSGKPNHDSPGR